MSDDKHDAHDPNRPLPLGSEYVVRALPNIELKPAEGDGSLGVIEGYAARFNEPAPIDSAKEGQFIERVAKGAFLNAIDADKARYRMLFEHGTHPKQGRLPLGPLDEISEDEQGARYKGRLMDTEFNRDLLPGLKAGLYGSSFLGKLHYSDPDYTAGRSDHNPEGWPEMTVVKVRPLLDVGPTPFPAYLGTVTSARSLTDEFLFRHFESGVGLQKFAEWAAEQSNDKVQMPVKEPVTEERSTPAKPPQDKPAIQKEEPVMAADIDRFTSRETLAERRDEVGKRIRFLSEEYTGRAFSTEAQNEWDDLNEEIDQLKERIEVLDKREARLRSIFTEDDGIHVIRDPHRSGVETVVPEEGYKPRTFETPKSRVPENVFDIAAYRANARSLEDANQLMVAGAMRAIELAPFNSPRLGREDLQAQAETTLKVSSGESNEDPTTVRGKIALHYLSTGSQLYKRAFGRFMAEQSTAALSPEESHELFKARAMSLTGAAGGFAVPFELDPTILLTNAGTINHIRQVSRVIQIAGDEWRGVTSAGVTAAYAAEATETTDNAPTLVQPTISTEKAQAFIPFSIEVGMDWDGLQTEMARALSDAKDRLEATKFMTGTGTNEPAGVLTGTTNTVNAAAGQTFTLANLYSLLAALPVRFQNSSTFMGNLAVINRIRQFDTQGGAALWVQLGAAAPPTLIGLPALQASDMVDVATGAKFLLLGDFSRFVIVDRIGLSVDLIPHIVGANHRPTGQRGIYAYWRNGSAVVDASAFRALLGVV